VKILQNVLGGLLFFDSHCRQLGPAKYDTICGATENAGLENAAPDCRGGKRGSSTVWKAEVSVI